MRARGDESSRVAVVTGGARGLGYACAQRLAREGHRVALLDRDLDGLSDPPLGGGPHHAVRVDITRRADVAAAIGAVGEQLGAPTIVVNAAGTLRPTRFEQISEDEWDLVFDVSVKGTLFVSQACIPGMRAASFGRIVNFSSTAGKSVSTLGGAHYTSAKAAVLGLTRAIAKECAADGVTVNAVCPGLFDTEMTRITVGRERLERYAASFPIPRLGEPGEVAALVAFLCGDEAGYITGAALDVNGGDLMV
jgi:3-oxoacyl-[acyl-carrier protein] reductase